VTQRGEGPLGSQPTQEVRRSLAVGIDVGAYKCAAAVWHQGEREAERKVLNITTKRGGFADLDASRGGAP
jgi:hypothetical protein